MGYSGLQRDRTLPEGRVDLLELRSLQRSRQEILPGVWNAAGRRLPGLRDCHSSCGRHPRRPGPSSRPDMSCTNCGTVNPTSAKFCVECGVRLGGSCPNCGSETNPGAKFCAECGTNLAAGTVR